MAGKKLVEAALDFLRTHPSFKPYQSTWRGDRPSIYDPNFFDLKLDHLTDEAGNILATKQIPVPKDHLTFDLPAAKDPEKIFRGMSAEEFANFQKNKYLQSLGTYNIGEQQKGLTYFSIDPDMARSYAHSFAPSDFHPDPSRPAYVVAVKRPPEDRIAPQVPGTSEAEVGIMGQIPREDVTNVYRGNVVSYTDALDEPGMKINPSSSIHWEEINDYAQGGAVEREHHSGGELVGKALRAVMGSRADKYVADPAQRAANLARWQAKTPKEVTDPTWYHGTFTDVESLRPGRADATFLSKDPDFANRYATPAD